MQVRFGSTHPHVTQFGNEQQAVQFSGDKDPKSIEKRDKQKEKGGGGKKGGKASFASNNWIA